MPYNIVYTNNIRRIVLYVNTIRKSFSHFFIFRKTRLHNRSSHPLILTNFCFLFHFIPLLNLSNQNIPNNAIHTFHTLIHNISLRNLSNESKKRNLLTISFFTCSSLLFHNIIPNVPEIMLLFYILLSQDTL